MTMGTAGLLTAGLLLSSLFIVGHGNRTERAEFTSGTAWLASYVPGQLTLLDGATGKISDQLSGSGLPGIKPGDPFATTQAGSDALVGSPGTGVLDRIDGSTNRVTSTYDYRAALTADISLYPAGHRLFVINAANGLIDIADPTTLRTVAAPIALPVEENASVVDSDGNLWVVNARTGQVDQVNGRRSHGTATRVSQRDRIQMVEADNRPALVDFSGPDPEARLINPSSVTAKRPVCLGITPGDPLAVAGGSAAERVWIASGTTGQLIETDLRTGRCTGRATLTTPGARLGAPLEADGMVFVPIDSSGQVAVVDPRTLRLIGNPLDVTSPASALELFAKDGIVFYNNPFTQDAGIIHPDGTLIRVRKYMPQFEGGPAIAGGRESRTGTAVRATGGALVATGATFRTTGAGNSVATDVTAEPTGAGQIGGQQRITARTPAAPPHLVITSLMLASAIVGEPYHQTLSAAGGDPPYTWSVTGLPAGLHVASDGIISGVPSAAGSYSLSAAVTDAHSVVAAGPPLVLNVYPPATQPPVVTGVSPNKGPPTGGNDVTITGLHLAGASRVLFGATPATNVTVASDTDLIVTAPAGSAATVVDVTVSNREGTSPVDAFDKYAYVQAQTPTISAISQAEGLDAGGSIVVITGTHLARTKSVDFGNWPASSFTVSSDSLITAITPSAAPGTVDITVSSPRGTSTRTAADRYTFIEDLSATRWIHTPSFAGDVVPDGQGNFFVSFGYFQNGILTEGDNAIFLMRPNGTMIRYAGTGQIGYNGDGIPATKAELNNPSAMALDAAGNLYIADQFNDRVRKVDRRTGIISTVAGSFLTCLCGMGGPADKAGIFNPVNLAFGANGDLYIASRNAQVVLRVAADNGIVGTTSIVTVYAGMPMQAGPPLGDRGPATSAHLFMPNGLAIDRSGNLYIGDDWDGRIRKVTPLDAGHIITTVAGGGILETAPYAQNALSVILLNPTSVALDPFGDLYIAEYNGVRVDRLTPSGTISSVVGGEPGPGDGNPPETARFGQPANVTFVPSPVADAPAGGTLYVCDPFNERIAAVS
jgi:sugar lactone lactonase YvrE